MNSVSDIITRYYLDLKNNIRYFFNVTSYGKDLIKLRTKNFKLVFYDNFSKDLTNNWIYGDSWWEQPYHPKDLTHWYDRRMVTQSKNGLNLSIGNNSKYFEKINKVIPVSVGNIHSKEGFYHGLYIFEAKLPEGKYLWPSIWLSGIETWPPEIDILECWSQSDSNYKKHKNFTTNLHYTNDKGQKDHYGTYRHPMALNAMYNYVEYALLWTKDKIEIFYNGYKVFKCTNKKILKNLNSQKMRIVLNNYVTKENATQKSDFIIKNVSFYKCI